MKNKRELLIVALTLIGGYIGYKKNKFTGAFIGATTGLIGANILHEFAMKKPLPDFEELDSLEN
jgi:hypothetical protein